MAQTIAMQRGGLSITTNGSWNTLFTQSSGTAARVIPNQFNGYFVYSPIFATIYFHVAIVSNSGGGQILCGTQGMYSSQIQSWQIACTGNQSAGNVSSANPPLYQSVLVNGSSAGSTPYNSGYSSVNTSLGPAASSGITPIGQFFLGNGDSLQLRAYATRNAGKGSVPNNMQIYWNMTTITES